MAIEAIIVSVIWLFSILAAKLQWDMRKFPPGPNSIPFVGNLWLIPYVFPNVLLKSSGTRTSFFMNWLHFVISLMKKKRNPRNVEGQLVEGADVLKEIYLPFLDELEADYGTIFTFWLGYKPVVVLSGFDAVKDGLVTHSEKMSGWTTTAFFDEVINQNGILLVNGQKWRQQRDFDLATVQKLSTGERGIEHRVREEASQLLELFARQKGQPLNPLLCITHAVSNAISSVVFSHRFSFEDTDFHRIIGHCDNFADATVSPYDLIYYIIPRFIRSLIGPPEEAARTFRGLVTYTKKQIRSHEMNRRLCEPQDFIDFYLDQISKTDNPISTFDEETLTQIIVQLFAAGAATTATTLQWALLYMVAYPEIQAKVQKELDDVLEPFQGILYKDLEKLPYTKAVLHEIQRVSCPVAVTFRQCIEDITVQDFPIKKDTVVIADLRSVLYDPGQWETPRQFNPNHFLDQDGNFVTNEAFMSFSAGNNGCLGEQLARTQLFIYFSSLLRAFTFQAPEGAEEMSTEPAVKNFIIWPRSYKLCAIPRKAARREEH